MDYSRFLRAMEAENMELLEERKRLFLAKKIESLSPMEWQQIREHDAWVEE